MLREYFADELCRIMGIERSQLDLEQPLNEIGMDSLLAMELKTNLELRLAFSLPMAAFLQRPSVATLAGHAAKALAEGTGEAASQSASVMVRDIASWTPLVTLQPAGNALPLLSKLRISSGSSRIPKNSGGRGLDAALRNAPNSGEFGYGNFEGRCSRFIPWAAASTVTTIWPGACQNGRSSGCAPW